MRGKERRSEKGDAKARHRALSFLFTAFPDNAETILRPSYPPPARVSFFQALVSTFLNPLYEGLLPRDSADLSSRGSFIPLIPAASYRWSYFSRYHSVDSSPPLLLFLSRASPSATLVLSPTPISVSINTDPFRALLISPLSIPVVSLETFAPLAPSSLKFLSCFHEHRI